MSFGKILPNDMNKLLERLRHGADSCIEIIKLELITMNYIFVFEKI